MGVRKRYYPKIPSTRDCPGGRCIAFEKYDGTNLHWRWHRKLGWHAFGTRRDEFPLTDSGTADFAAAHSRLATCVEVFAADLANGVESVFRDHPDYRSYDELVAFTEYFGSQSFAGLHRPDDPKELRLFDVFAEGFGLIGPRAFADDFDHPARARVVYEGKLTGEFAEDVRNGRYDVEEGVVCKGGRGGEDLWMAKIKTHAYMHKLKTAFDDRWEQYWE